MGNDGDLFWKLLEPEYLQGMMFCRKLMKDRDEGDDLYQDALVLAFTKFGDLRDKGAFRTWFYRIIINRFKSTVRRPWWKRRLVLTEDIEMQLVGENPVDRLTAKRWLDRAFEAISTEDQTLVTLYELEGWGVADLAGLYHTTEGAVKARLFRARRKMKDALIKFSRKAELNKNGVKIMKEGCKCDVVKPG